MMITLLKVKEINIILSSYSLYGHARASVMDVIIILTQSLSLVFSVLLAIKNIQKCVLFRSFLSFYLFLPK